MILLENLINLRNISVLQDLNCHSVENLPVHIFIKDRQGKYLNCNDTVAQTAGLKKKEDLIGVNDRELCWKGDASIAISNDQEVMKTGNSKYESIYIHDHNNILHAVKGLKSPLYTKLNKIIGVIGFSIIQKLTPTIVENFGLTKRKLHCLSYLIRGWTAIEIANRFFISKRTVEKHIENIKDKLDCSTKSELIDKSMSLGLIHFNLTK